MQSRAGKTCRAFVVAGFIRDVDHCRTLLLRLHIKHRISGVEKSIRSVNFAQTRSLTSDRTADQKGLAGGCKTS
jgi:hypothetical protein